MPILTLIAGPNGCGKSTLSAYTDFQGRERLLDPDAIARTLNPSNPAAVAITAGRETLRRIAEYLDLRVSFAIETTLSSRNNADLIGEAKSLGYQIHFIFVCVDSPELCIRRIRNRTARGGHFVPDAIVRRRYAKSAANAAQTLKSVDITKFYDNSGDGHRLVLKAEAGVVVWQADPLPEWVRL